MYYWKIDDGRIWSAEAVAFVDGVPDGEAITPLNKNGEPAGPDYLREIVLFYGCELGELGTRLDKIQAIQAEYAPQLTALQEAKSGADMRDDAEGVAEIKAEYVALLQEMNAKIQTVPHD